MARKWSNLNLPGALHFVTGNFLQRTPVFTEPACCSAFLEELSCLNQKWPSKLIAYVLMPDHFHLISNPRDGRIKEFVGALKSLSAKSIVRVSKQFRFHAGADGHQVWQESFKALPLWSGWMIWQKINYIHANPVKAGLVSSAKDYNWSSFRSFHSQGDEPVPVDHEWSWPEDAEKLSKAVKDLAKSGASPLPNLEVFPLLQQVTHRRCGPVRRRLHRAGQCPGGSRSPETFVVFYVR